MAADVSVRSLDLHFDVELGADVHISNRRRSPLASPVCKGVTTETLVPALDTAILKAGAGGIHTAFHSKHLRPEFPVGIFS